MRAQTSGVSPLGQITRTILILALGAALLLGACARTAPGPGTTATEAEPRLERSGRVVHLVNGCNLIVDAAGAQEQVRLNGVVCPAYDEDWGPDATAFTLGATFGRTVGLEMDAQTRDADGVLLANVWVDGILLNEALVTEGMALPFATPPNLKYSERLDRAMVVAKESGTGFWQEGGMFVAPEDQAGPGNLL